MNTAILSHPIHPVEEYEEIMQSTDVPDDRFPRQHLTLLNKAERPMWKSIAILIGVTGAAVVAALVAG